MKNSLDTGYGRIENLLSPGRQTCLRNIGFHNSHVQTETYILIGVGPNSELRSGWRKPFIVMLGPSRYKYAIILILGNRQRKFIGLRHGEIRASN